MIAAGDRLAGLFIEAAEAAPECFNVISLAAPFYGANPAPYIFVLPYAYDLTGDNGAALDQFHWRLDETAVFDLGRYLAEEISAVRREKADNAY